MRSENFALKFSQKDIWGGILDFKIRKGKCDWILASSGEHSWCLYIDIHRLILRYRWQCSKEPKSKAQNSCLIYATHSIFSVFLACEIRSESVWYQQKGFQILDSECFKNHPSVMKNSVWSRSAAVSHVCVARSRSSAAISNWQGLSRRPNKICHNWNKEL